MRFATAILLLTLATLAAERKPQPHKGVFPPGVKPVGPYSPGVVAGGFLYVSGQGARDASGQLAPDFDDQVRQCLENVKAILESEKLTTTHVVSASVYLTDLKNYEALNRAWAKYFPRDPPARTVIGVTRMPTETPVEIAVVALLDLKRKKLVSVPGQQMQEPVTAAINVGDRVFFSGGPGLSQSGALPKEPADQVKLVISSAESALKQSGLDMRHIVYANIYVDPGMPLKMLAEVIEEAIPDETARTIIQTSSLPFGAHIIISGVASRGQRRVGGHCTSVSDTVYCSGRVGTIRQSLESLKADLKAGKFDLSRVVSSNVYLDDIDEFAAMNKVYAGYFSSVPPSRTTVQPWKRVAELSLPPTTGVAPSRDSSPRAQVSIVAVR
ncbi:MAG: hypothetical protein H7Y20_07570 [Bryobacteraceae bacterium]|nr:hypothetical protein [Bryobacteraceae bacterium]